MPGGLKEIATDGIELLGPELLAERRAGERVEEWMRPLSAEKAVYSLSW